MNFFQTLHTAWLDLTLHKFRTALATLGVIFGVASVVAMLSISEGARRETLNRIAALGVDNITAQTVKPTTTGQKEGGERVPSYGLLRRDLEHVRRTFAGVHYAVGLRDVRTTLFAPSGRELDLRVMATEPDYLKITRSAMRRGRFIHPLDEYERRRVCVLGRNAARELFRFEDPLGQSIRVREDWFRVIGILDNAASIKAAGGEDLNRYVFIPLATARALYGDVSVTRKQGSFEVVRVELDGMAIRAASVDAVEPMARRLERYLDKTHDEPDFQLLVPLELIRQSAAAQRVFSIVMASIAAISLLVGGIGIMNIMLANVSERRKEIGTRRALGARKVDILGQFLVESATLTGLGGLAGVGAGYALSETVSRYAGWTVAITPWSVALGLIVSCAVGVGFGLWPAYQAAKVSPIEALRSE